MPFVQRQIQPVFVCNGRLPASVVDNEREAVANAALVGALRQLASLMRHTEQLYDQLVEQQQAVHVRVDRLRMRVANVQQRCAQLDSRTVPVPESDLSTFSRLRHRAILSAASDTHAGDDDDGMPRLNLFTTANRPATVAHLYQQAVLNPVHVLRSLDTFRRDGQRSSRFFTCTPTLESRTSRISLDIESRMPAEVQDLPAWTGATDSHRLMYPVHPDVRYTKLLCSPSEQALVCRLPSPGQLAAARRRLARAETVTVDTSGARFQRLINFRRSLIQLDYVKQRKKRRTRQRRSSCGESSPNDTSDNVCQSASSRDTPSTSVDAGSGGTPSSNSQYRPDSACRIGGDVTTGGGCSDSGVGSGCSNRASTDLDAGAAAARHPSSSSSSATIVGSGRHQQRRDQPRLNQSSCAEEPYDDTDDASSAFSCDAEGYYTSFHCDSGVRTVAAGSGSTAAVDGAVSGSSGSVVLRRRQRSAVQHHRPSRGPTPPIRASSLSSTHIAGNSGAVCATEATTAGGGSELADRSSVVTVVHVTDCASYAPPSADTSSTRDAGSSLAIDGRDDDGGSTTNSPLPNGHSTAVIRVPALCVVTSSDDGGAESDSTLDGGSNRPVAETEVDDEPSGEYCGECSGESVSYISSDRSGSMASVALKPQPDGVSQNSQLLQHTTDTDYNSRPADARTEYSVVMKSVLDRDYVTANELLAIGGCQVPNVLDDQQLSESAAQEGDLITIRRPDSCALGEVIVGDRDWRTDKGVIDATRSQKMDSLVVEYVSISHLPSPQPLQSAFSHCALFSSQSGHRSIDRKNAVSLFVCDTTVDHMNASETYMRQCRRHGSRIRVDSQGQILYSSTKVNQKQAEHSSGISESSFDPGECLRDVTTAVSIYVRRVINPRRPAALASSCMSAQMADRPMQPLPINSSVSVDDADVCGSDSDSVSSVVGRPAVTAANFIDKAVISAARCTEQAQTGGIGQAGHVEHPTTDQLDIVVTELPNDGIQVHTQKQYFLRDERIPCISIVQCGSDMDDEYNSEASLNSTGESTTEHGHRFVESHLTASAHTPPPNHWSGIFIDDGTMSAPSIGEDSSGGSFSSNADDGRCILSDWWWPRCGCRNDRPHCQVTRSVSVSGTTTHNSGESQDWRNIQKRPRRSHSQPCVSQRQRRLETAVLASHMQGSLADGRHWTGEMLCDSRCHSGNVSCINSSQSCSLTSDSSVQGFSMYGREALFERCRVLFTPPPLPQSIPSKPHKISPLPNDTQSQLLFPQKTIESDNNMAANRKQRENVGSCGSLPQVTNQELVGSIQQITAPPRVLSSSTFVGHFATMRRSIRKMLNRSVNSLSSGGSRTLNLSQSSKIVADKRPVTVEGVGFEEIKSKARPDFVRKNQQSNTVNENTNVEFAGEKFGELAEVQRIECIGECSLGDKHVFDTVDQELSIMTHSTNPAPSDKELESSISSTGNVQLDFNRDFHEQKCSERHEPRTAVLSQESKADKASLRCSDRIDSSTLHNRADEENVVTIPCRAQTTTHVKGNISQANTEPNREANARDIAVIGPSRLTVPTTASGCLDVAPTLIVRPSDAPSDAISQRAAGGAYVNLQSADSNPVRDVTNSYRDARCEVRDAADKTRRSSGVRRSDSYRQGVYGPPSSAALINCGRREQQVNTGTVVAITPMAGGGGKQGPTDAARRRSKVCSSGARRRLLTDAADETATDDCDGRLQPWSDAQRPSTDVFSNERDGASDLQRPRVLRADDKDHRQSTTRSDSDSHRW